MIHMVSKNSKIFFIILLFVVLSSIAYTYYDTMFLRRFDIFVSEDEIPTYSDLLGETKGLVDSYVQ